MASPALYRRRRRSGGAIIFGGPNGGSAVTDVTDSFDRADSALSLGTADSGHVWNPDSGTWGISTNRAYLVGSPGGRRFATVDSGRSVFTGQVTLAVATATEFPGLVFSFSDTSNALWAIVDATTIYVQKMEAGGVTTLGSAANALANGQVLKVTRNGSAIEAFIDNVSKVAVNNAFNSTATRHGLTIGVGGTDTSRFDVFSVAA